MAGDLPLPRRRRAALLPLSARSRCRRRRHHAHHHRRAPAPLVAVVADRVGDVAVEPRVVLEDAVGAAAAGRRREAEGVVERRAVALGAEVVLFLGGGELMCWRVMFAAGIIATDRRPRGKASKDPK